MPIPFIMPKMDMDQESVTIIEWLKKEGDHIEKGEPVIVVETDKITSEIEAPATGKLAGLLYHENEIAPVTKVVAYVLKEGETDADLPSEDKSEEQIEEPSVASQESNLPLPLRKAHLYQPLMKLNKNLMSSLRNQRKLHRELKHLQLH